MVSALEAVMGRDAPHRVVPHPVTDLGMTQGKLHFSNPIQSECFSSGSLSQGKFGDFCFPNHSSERLV
jgi:hypothetical protein